MPQIKQRTTTYIIGKPANIPADSVEVNLNSLAEEITKLGESIFDIQGVDGEEEPQQSTKVIRKLSSDKGELEALVVEMTNEFKTELNKRHKEAIIIEQDEPIYPLDMEFNDDFSISSMQNIVPTSDTDKLTICIVIKNINDQPIENARVTATGLLWVESGYTDTKGKVQLTLIDETKESISSIEVKPANTFWSTRVNDPVVSDTEDNEIILNKIDNSFSVGGSETKQQYIGWGQQEMRLNKLPKQSGVMNKPVKIAVIDSGITSDHVDLSPKGGFDLGTTGQANKSWKKDGSGHGTHVAGISAALNNELGILGFAPDSELYVLRVFPNASNSKLIGALDWCIDNDIDVINMSLGGKKASQLIQQRLEACRENGILPIAAAGNNGGKVLFPAAFDEVLSVAAIGRFDAFPEDSSHHKHIGDKPIQSNHYFAPKFTCRGPEIDVCAPGVAIVSTVPGNGYAAWDGTSMACPHVTGFAARLLQRQTNILNLPRNAIRSQTLLEEILKSCQFLDGIPSIYQGKGIPIFPLDLTSRKEIVEPHKDYLNDVSKLLDEAIQVVKIHIDNH